MPSRGDPGGPDRWTRREALATSGAWVIGAGLVASGCGDRPSPATNPPSRSLSEASCVLTPEQTEGPYHLDLDKFRTDITEGRDGTPLELRLTVQRVGACEPIAGATVEVWHCDALGVYSGFTAAGSGGGGGPGPPPDGPGPGGTPPGPPPAGGQNPGYGPRRSAERPATDRTTFLRGAQRSDRRGLVRFRTIVPGWYQGRTPHVHLKAHVGGDEVHTGQLYFDDAITSAVYHRAPYRSHGQASTTNSSDGIYGQGGRDSTLALREAGDGYTGSLTLVVQA